MEQYDWIMSLLVPLVSVYCFYIWYMQKYKGKIGKCNFFLPCGALLDNCSNREGYFEESTPEIWKLAIISFVFGSFDIVASRIEGITLLLESFLRIFYVLYLLSFSKKFQPIIKRYWPNLRK